MRCWSFILQILLSTTLGTMSACQAPAISFEASQPNRVSWTEAEKLLGPQSMFEVPKEEGTQTSRDTLFRLADALDLAY